MVPRVFAPSMFRLLLVLFLSLMGWAPTLQAQEYQTAADLVTWTPSVYPASIAPGESVELTLSGHITEGWKMYALDSPRPSRGVRVRMDDLPQGLVANGDVTQLEPHEGFDPNFGIDVRYFNGRAELYVPLKATEEAVPGALPLSGTINFMICNDKLCLPPTNVTFSANLTIEGEGSSSEGAVVPAPPSLQQGGILPLEPPTQATPEATPAPEMAPAEIVSDYRESRAGGFFGFLLLAIGAGLASLLMPCVFPMIPLTVSYFTKHADNRSEAMRMATVYGLAIVLTFTGLGVLMALFVGAAGAQTIAANPWVNLFIGLIFVVFALSLLGLFELRLPSGLLNFFNKQSNERGGYLGVLFMGFTLTLVSFSCTAPFVGGLLAATAIGEWTFPIAGMLVYSATFALPFFLFALFPRGLSALPRSGAWMNTLKVVLGFVELAAALKFLSNADLVWGWNVLSRPLAIALSVVVFFLTGMYLIGKLRLKHEAALEQVGVGRLISAVGFFGLSLYLLPGLFGAPLNALDAYLPPRQANDVSLVSTLIATGNNDAHGEEGWFTDDIEGAFAEAEQLGKPVFIDFTGYTCTNCRQMEANVFPRPDVSERFTRDFVLLRLFTDGLEQGEEFQRFQFRMTGTVALPTYAIVSPHERQLLDKVSGIVAVPEFVAFLDEGAATFQENQLASR